MPSERYSRAPISLTVAPKGLASFGVASAVRYVRETRHGSSPRSLSLKCGLSESYVATVFYATDLREAWQAGDAGEELGRPPL